MENLCLFWCLLCPIKETFDKFCSLRTHYAKAHGQSKVSFRAEFLAEARYHRCWECRRIVLCEKKVGRVLLSLKGMMHLFCLFIYIIPLFCVEPFSTILTIK